MNTGKGFSKMWFLVLLLAAFVAGCGSNNNDTVPPGSAPPSSAKAITAYSINGAAGIISETTTPKTIAVTVPFSTPSVTGLIATFSTSGSSVKVGLTAQINGTTPNNFTSPVVYTVTAADGSSVNYTVTVAKAQITDKAITAYSIAGQVSSAITGTAIAVTMPFSTPSVTNLVATFSTSGASVTVGLVTQASGTTPNDFTNPVVYTVTAADNSTATYTVTVTKASSLAPINLLTAGDFVILANSAVTYNGIAAAAAVTGDVGISPNFAAGITGFGSYAVDATNDFATAAEVVSPGKIYAPDFTGGQLGSTGLTPAKMTSAQNDMVTAYNDASNRTPGVGATNLNVGAGTLTGNNFPPGTYTWNAGTPGGNVNITGDITLTGSATDVWIFQISGALNQSSATNVFLGGTAKAKNIFWQVAGGVTLNTTAHMEGVLLSATAITLNAGATANSRLLAQTAVTLGGTVAQPAN